MNLYYMIWVDGILKAKSIPANKDNWKSMTLISISMAMALNIATIMSIIQLRFVGYVFYDISFNIFPGEKLNNALSFFLLYFIVPLIINYLLIFRNSRYEKLINNYKHYDGKLFFVYFFGTLIITFIYGVFFTPTV